jgi:hypothetical protein
MRRYIRTRPVSGKIGNNEGLFLSQHVPEESRYG